MEPTTFFRKPSFFKGVARAFDLYGKIDVYAHTDDPDTDQIRNDWENVGKDVNQILRSYGKKSYSQ